MHLHEQFKRRVRIVGKPDDTEGWSIHIIDVETGEEIRQVKKAVITLLAGELNMVELTYYEADETDRIIVLDEKLSEKHITLHFPEIDVTAFERLQKEKGNTPPSS